MVSVSVFPVLNHISLFKWSWNYPLLIGVIFFRWHGCFFNGKGDQFPFTYRFLKFWSELPQITDSGPRNSNTENTYRVPGHRINVGDVVGDTLKEVEVFVNFFGFAGIVPAASSIRFNNPKLRAGHCGLSPLTICNPLNNIAHPRRSPTARRTLPTRFVGVKFHDVEEAINNISCLVHYNNPTGAEH